MRVELAEGQMYGLSQTVTLKCGGKQREGLALEFLGVVQVAEVLMRQRRLAKNLSRAAKGKPSRWIVGCLVECGLREHECAARSPGLTLAGMAERHPAVKECAQPRIASRTGGFQRPPGHCDGFAAPAKLYSLPGHVGPDPCLECAAVCQVGRCQRGLEETARSGEVARIEAEPAP